MDGSLPAFAACGAAGALMYSFPLYIKAASRTPPVKYAKTNCAFAVFVGCVAAMLFTESVGYYWPWTVEPTPWPLALVLGLGSNPLVPIILGRLESWMQSFGGVEK